MPRTDTETHCHCGGAYGGSDHCPECGCEQYETINVRDCGHTTQAITSQGIEVSIGYDGCIDIIIPTNCGTGYGSCGRVEVERSIPPAEWAAIVAWVAARQG